MVQTLPGRQIERPLVLGKGWLEIGLGVDRKVATGAWGPMGQPVEWEPGTRFTYDTHRMDLRYGLSRRVELTAQLKTHWVEWEQPGAAADLEQFGIGDPRFGVVFEAFRAQGPLTSLVFVGNIKGAAANESPGDIDGDPSTFSRFVMTTGTSDLELGVRGKHQLGPMAITLDAAGVYRSSDVTQYMADPQHPGFNQRIQPGSLGRVGAELLLQLGPVACSGGAVLTARSATRVGSTAPGLFPARNLRVLDGSEGIAVDARAATIVHLSRRIDAIVGVQVPMLGEDWMYFPIEDLHPTRGTTTSATLALRH